MSRLSKQVRSYETGATGVVIEQRDDRICVRWDESGKATWCDIERVELVGDMYRLAEWLEALEAIEMPDLTQEPERTIASTVMASISEGVRKLLRLQEGKP